MSKPQGQYTPHETVCKPCEGKDDILADPWLKFFTSDWRSDPRLRMCSAAARGFWIESICLMHEATPYGHLLVSGLSPTDAQLGVLTGIPPEQIPGLVGELETAGVFSRTRKGEIYSRKMTRMQKKAATARNNGRKGGNPSLGKERENPALDNPEVKAGVKPRSQKPEPDIVEIGKPISCPFSEFWQGWPNKVSKASAEKAWRKLTHDEKREAVRRVAPWFNAWRAQNPQASPIHAATYLNQKRWQDQPSLPVNIGGQHGKTTGEGERVQRIVTAAARGTSGKDWG